MRIEGADEFGKGKLGLPYESDWNSGPYEVLCQVDQSLVVFGFEVVMRRSEGTDDDDPYRWYIRPIRRSK